MKSPLFRSGRLMALRGYLTALEASCILSAEGTLTGCAQQPCSPGLSHG